MANYDFKELSSYDFELLIRDILQEKLDVFIESFKSGRDNGIDLRYSKDKNNSVIIQCKHYANSTFSNLKTSLKAEVEKLDKIKCKKYMVVTSMGLTPLNKDELLEILSPYCNSTEDILGNEDINNLLGKYPDVEKMHYKLWLTSTTLMEKILHSEVYNQSQIEVDYLKDKCKYYVQNRSFFVALEMLNKLNYCIITGIPGIGKTTLAEIIILYFLDKEYEIYKVSNDIGEAYKVYNSNKKQLFYYDDFLGQTALEDKLNKNEDEKIIKFIRTISKNKKSKFILTTREYILNNAKIYYEKFNNFDFDINQCSIKLSDYTNRDKAKILYNHLYFSRIPAEIIEDLIKTKKYISIINHLNYNPRIIEWMTEKYDTKNSKDFYETIISMLDNPKNIWEHIFNNQLKAHSKNLLIILVTLPNLIMISDLKKAFENFNSYICEKYLGKRSRDDFDKALKELEGNFIKINNKNNTILVSFANPSVKDFIEGIVYNEKDIYMECLDSTIFFTQIRGLISIKSKDINAKDFKLIISKVLEDKFTSEKINLAPDSITLGKDYDILTNRLNYIVEFFQLNNIENRELIYRLYDILLKNLKFIDLEYFPQLLISLKKYNITNIDKDSIGVKIGNIIFEEVLQGVSLEAWGVIVNIIKVFERNIESNTINFIRNTYRELYKDIIEEEIEFIDASELLVESIDLIEYINEYFGVDDDEAIDHLKNELDMLLEKESSKEYYDEDQAYEEYREAKMFGIRNDDSATIDDMFESLLN